MCGVAVIKRMLIVKIDIECGQLFRSFGLAHILDSARRVKRGQRFLNFTPQIIVLQIVDFVALPAIENPAFCPIAAIDSVGPVLPYPDFRHFCKHLPVKVL